MVVVERAAVLRKAIQLPSQTAPRAPIDTMAVCCAHNIRPRLVDRRMDHIRRSIQQPVLAPSNHLSCMVDEDQIGFVHHAESAAERVDPKAVWLYRIAERDMACNALVVSVFAEDAEGGCEAAFEIFALFMLVFEGGWSDGFIIDQLMLR